MSLKFSAAHSSRITKKSRNRALERSSSSPFKSMPRRKPNLSSQSPQENADDDNDFFEDRLDEKYLVHCLNTNLSLRDVPQSVQYSRAHMFDPVPERGGLNSIRIAEILNFRKSLPPTATLAHIHALIGSPSATERQIAELTTAGVIRRLMIPGRGTGASIIGEGIILTQDLEKLLKEADGLDQEVKEKFWQSLVSSPMALRISGKFFTDLECIALMSAGFLTAASPSLNSANIFARPDSPSSRTTTSLLNISRAASGSMAAVGGDGAIHGAGYTGKGGMIRRTSSQIDPSLEQEASYPGQNGQEFHLALPNTGPYLKLLAAARSHLIALLLRTRYRELPENLLRERWEGGSAGDDYATKAKKYRGEFSGILPGRTKKWKQFFGLAFDWILAECVGAGLVEIFETGNMGRAVRSI